MFEKGQLHISQKYGIYLFHILLTKKSTVVFTQNVASANRYDMQLKRPIKNNPLQELKYEMYVFGNPQIKD